MKTVSGNFHLQENRARIHLLIGRHEIHLGGRDDRHVAPMGPDVVPEDQHGIADQQHDLRTLASSFFSPPQPATKLIATAEANSADNIFFIFNVICPFFTVCTAFST